VVGTLHLAALAAGTGDLALARERVAPLSAADVGASPALALLRDAIAAALDGAPAERWEALVARAGDADDEDRLLVLWLRAITARRAGRAAEATAALRLARDALARQRIAWPGPFAAIATEGAA
jgi:hypothetical protein